MKKTNLKIKKKFLNRAVFFTALLLVAGLLFTGCPQKPEVKPETKTGEPMTLTLNQSPEKTVLTKNKVTISFTSSTSVKTAKWKKGVHSAKDVLASGTAITGNSFEVSENSKYSVAVQDNEGRREVEIIEISNIDKEPPSKVKNLIERTTIRVPK